jgi:putative flippase GtrA
MRRAPEQRPRARNTGLEGCAPRPPAGGCTPELDGSPVWAAHTPAVSLAPPVLDLVVPVHNEEAGLESSLRRLHDYLTRSFPFTFRITVAENASTDRTVEVGRRLAAELPGVEMMVLPEAGRGRALRAAWLASDAAVLAYMDVDLSTDLAALLPLVAPLVSGHSDLAIGSRLSPSSRVVRGAKRELISRSYNLLLRGTLRTSLPDAQCGFKAIRADVAQRVLPLVEDDGWFFDTELLFLAERIGLRIHQVPVDWVDDPDTRVNIVRTARADLAGIVRLLRGQVAGRLPTADLRARIGRHPLAGAPSGAPAGVLAQLAVYGAIGAVSTAAYLALFVLLRGGSSAQVANLVALLATAVVNTAANRSLTFGVRGREGAGRAQLQGLLVTALGLALTSGALTLVHATTARPTRTVEVAVLVGASAAAAALRFVLLRSWVFRSDRAVTGIQASDRPATTPAAALAGPQLAA